MAAPKQDIVRDRRAEYAFHDDIVYLRQAKRGLTPRHGRGDQRPQGRAGVDAPVPPARLRALPEAAHADLGRRPRPRSTSTRSSTTASRPSARRSPGTTSRTRSRRRSRSSASPRRSASSWPASARSTTREVVYHSVKEELSKLGVVFMGTDQALKEYPEIFKKYFGTVVPPEDNKFSALNSAVWSGGSFVYVPPGVDVPLPLQAYFRINGENTGQFERTLIVVDEGASVHYIEGCTAPIYATDSLHVAVVEVIALPKAKVRYTTIQNWSNDVYNLVTKRAHAYEDATVEWIDANTGSHDHDQVPEHLPARQAGDRGHHHRRRGRQGPAPGHGRQGHPPGAGHEEPHRQQVGLQGRRPGHLPRPGQGRAGCHERRGQRPLRRAHARRRQPQRHVPVHRHPGGRHLDDPRGHGRARSARTRSST